MKRLTVFGSQRGTKAFLRLPMSTREHYNLALGQKVVLSDGKRDLTLAIRMAYKADMAVVNKIGNELLDNKAVGFIPKEMLALFTDEEVARLYIINPFEKEVDILVGSDPEFLFVDGINIINASLIPGLTKNTPLGHDGAMAELRPAPANVPEELTANVRSILLEYVEKEPLRKYDWFSACYVDRGGRDYPVGAHIHFDNTVLIRDLPLNDRMRLFAVTNKILDELLTIPLIRLDGKQGHNRRANCKMSPGGGFGNGYGKGYGYFGEWRTSNGHLEYRSLSGLVLSNPVIYSAVIGTAKAITEEVYSQATKRKLDKDFILPDKFNRGDIYKKDFNSWREIPLANVCGARMSSELVDNLMNKSTRVDITQQFIAKWLRKLRNFSTYGKYESYVEILGDILSSSSKSLDSLERNLKKTWNLT